jgi:hypothetical protein
MRAQRVLSVLTLSAIVVVGAGLAIAQLVSDGVRRAQEPSAPHRANHSSSADDPSPPAEPVKLIFVHHSCGENWLSDGDGRLGIALRDNGYFVSDTNYGWGPPDADLGYENIGDHTDIGHWYNWFVGPNAPTYTEALYTEYVPRSSYSRLSTDPGGENEIIVFKSCYPNSHLGGSPTEPPTTGPNPLRGQDAGSEHHTMGNAKAIYNDLLTGFAACQNKLFVVITAPPLMGSETDAAHAANALAFNDWLVADWLDGYAHDNVAVFDFYNVLTSNGGDRNTNDLGAETGNHHRWWDGAVQHVHPANNNYSAYWGGSGGGSHPTSAGNRKATGEFVDLLNVFYNRWSGGDATVTPTTTATAPPTTTATPTPSPTTTGTPNTSTPTPTATPPGGQQVMAFQNGVSPEASYAGAKDATITTWGGNTYANLGGLEYLQVGETGDADEFRLLVRFELDGWLPAEAEIDEAQLELRAYDSDFDDSPHDVVAHRLAEEWVEGDGWDLEADGRTEGVTWTTARPGVGWSSPGGDFDAAELARVTVAANPDGWVRWDVTSAAREWASGASGYGLLLEPDNAPWTHHQFRSSEYTGASLRPRLVVTYTSGSAATATPTTTSTPSATPTPGGEPSSWVYLPLILRDWSSHRATRTRTPTAASTARATPTPTSTAEVPVARIQPSDLVYQGAFAYPSGDAWAYSGHALAYYPAGDPAGPADGYPGSLYAAGNASDEFDLVGEIAIPEPVVSGLFDDLPQASVLQSLTDITQGRRDNCTYADGCLYRDVDGLAYLPNVDKVAWNLRDWYNTAGHDQDSLGWSNVGLTGARGVWHIGERPSDDGVFHNAKACNYLFRAPESFADGNLDGKWLIAGNHREAGALGGSQGPTLYALAPWEDGNPPSAGRNLDALALLYYREIYECVWKGEEDINEDPDPGVCDFPGYRAMDNWGGGAWVQTPYRTGILILGRKGLGDNCYGSTEVCGEDPCAPSTGYHAYPYEPQILFYDPEELTQVLAGTREPWEVLPYAIHTVEEVFDSECALLGAAAHDPARGLIYATEQEAGPWGETAVHVWRVD